MATLMTLELHFATNWSFEGTVDILYVDGSTGREQSYGSLAQGAYMSRETYPGHRWNARETKSRDLLMTVVATPASDNSALPHIVTIGADDRGLDPVKAATWRMGRSPREPLLACAATLSKILGNVLKAPDEPKYRTLKPANEKVRAALDVPGSLALLTCAGFEQSYVEGEARLVLPAGRSHAPLEVANYALQRLDALLTGKPPPPPPRGSAAASSSSVTDVSDPSSSSSAAAPEPSHRCAHCRAGIMNDLRNMLRGSNEVGGWRTHTWNGSGEYRFHCSKDNIDLCSKCYDKWKGGDASVHPLTSHFTIEAPITTLWGGSNYGPPPTPPMPSARNRRGPWG